MAVFLLSAGIAAAQQRFCCQARIPKYVEPLPLLEFEFINATSMILPGVPGALSPVLDAGLNTATFDVNAEEFRAQILPALIIHCCQIGRLKNTTCGRGYGEFGLGIHF